MTADIAARLPEMTDEELYAVNPAHLDRDGQNALLHELARRRREAVARREGARDIARWKARGYQARWLLFALVAAGLALAGYLSDAL
jgi:hypothetical protein